MQLFSTYVYIVVGKTSIITKFMYDNFEEAYQVIAPLCMCA